jgi:hypothetical protein
MMTSKSLFETMQEKPEANEDLGTSEGELISERLE